MDATTDRRIGPASILCTAFIAVELLAISLLAFVWAPAMGQMFEDFGRTTPLPLLTRIVSGGWWPTAWAALLLAMTAFAFSRRHGERRRVTILAVALFLGAVEPMLTLWGMYAPIFELAGKIKAE